MQAPSELPPSLLPALAPLSRPMVKHLLVRMARKHPQVKEVAHWDTLLEQTDLKRRDAFFYMNSYILSQDDPHITTAWLLETLSIYSPGQKRVPSSNISHWAGRGVLRIPTHGRPEPDSVAALLIARMLDPGERNFLPEDVKEEEPHWWCYAQTLQGTTFPCPLPLPGDLPASTLLWTPWAGAAWNPYWLKVGEDLGAIRFAGATLRQGRVEWQVTQRDLEQWTPHLAPQSIVSDNAQEGLRNQVRTTVASLALLQLATTRLGIIKNLPPMNRISSVEGSLFERPDGKKKNNATKGRI